MKKAPNIPGIRSLKPEYNENPDGILIVGSSCSGKTTLTRHIRSNCDGIFVPQRLITRPARSDDLEEENASITEQEFREIVESGEMFFSWIKPATGVSYGFRKNKSTKFPLFSCNNAILKESSQLQPSNIIDQIMVIGVDAPLVDRKARIQSRSPNMSETEKDKRLSDSIDGIFPFLDFVVDNSIVSQATAPNAVQQLVHWTMQNHS